MCSGSRRSASSGDFSCAAGVSRFLAGRAMFTVSRPVTLLVVAAFVGFSIIVASAESEANRKDE